jgi:hypothetical protein
MAQAITKFYLGEGTWGDFVLDQTVSWSLFAVAFVLTILF